MDEINMKVTAEESRETDEESRETNTEESAEEEEERQLRWRKRIEEMKREKRRRELLYHWGIFAAAVVAVLVGAGFGIGAAMHLHGDRMPKEPEGAQIVAGDGGISDSAAGVLAESGFDPTRGTAQAEGNEAEAESEPDSDVSGAGQSDRGNGEETEKDDILKDRRRNNVFAEAGRTGADVFGGPAGSKPLSTKAGSPPGGEADGDGTDSGETAEAGTVEGEEDVPASTTVTTAISRPANGLAPVETVVLAAYDTPDTTGFDENIISRYGVLIDAEDGVILAQKDARARMNPASMTKVLTVLVAAEYLTEEDLDERVTITTDITDYCVVNDCSITGYDVGDEATVRDLFYGTILPSGADAALALAKYVAGTHEAFVELMNKKLEEMGLSETTHFTNCVGLYDENHYSTAYDIAVILKAAADKEFCREVLSAHTYNTTLTEQHPEGLLISNWFLRRIEDRDTHGLVLCAKTGFVDEAGSCAVSLSVGNDGREYLCVTAGSASSWTCIDDQVALYQEFLPENMPEN